MAEARPLGAGEDPAERSRRKRSAAISLVLVTGAGAAALGLGWLDPSQKEEDALVYDSLAACIGQGLRTEDACTTDYAAAQSAYAATAPRYATAEACRAHHGADGCVAGETVAPDAAGSFVPLMAGYMIGRTLEQGLPAQPLYRHAEEIPASGGSGGGGGGYCTGSGGRVYASAGRPATRVASSVARTTASAPRMVSHGGFGATGRAIASAGSRSGGFGGG